MGKHRKKKPVELAFRRRCSWCAVKLRAWQLNCCRKCKLAVLYSPSPPVGHMSRRDEEPDRFTLRGRWS